MEKISLYCMRLKVLWLNYIPVGFGKIDSLSNFILETNNLEILGLSHTRLNRDQINELLKAIDKNEGLRDLDISSNQIGGHQNSTSTTVLLLSRLIIMHKTLQHLDISDCSLSPEECIYLG